MKRTTTIKIVLVAIFSIVSMTSVRAQRVALTSNLLEDVVLAPNLGVEVVFADTQSLFLEATVAPFKLTHHYYNKCLSFRAGYKYWFNQALYAHHLILDGVVTSSESGWGDTALRYEYLGAGLGYGYSFIINERLNLIPSIGVGVAYVRQYEGHDHMLDTGYGVQATVTGGFMPMLTRLALTLQYVLK